MPVEIINCNGYNAYKCEDSLYLIEPNIDIKNIKALLEHYSSDDLFVCNKIVLFGYSFKFEDGDYVIFGREKEGLSDEVIKVSIYEYDKEFEEKKLRKAINDEKAWLTPKESSARLPNNRA